MPNRRKSQAAARPAQGNAMQKRNRRKKRRSTAGPKALTFVTVPKAKTAIVRRTAPSTQSSRDGNTIRVRHREFVTGITNTANEWHVSDVLVINPANGTLFPWLSNIAACWEKYTFHSLRLEYVPRCPTTVSGTVGLLVDTDALDEYPVEESTFNQAYHAIETSAWQAASCSYTSAQLHGDMKQKYVGLYAQDVRTAHCGNIHVATSGDWQEFGKLWVTYDVSLYVPHVPRSLTTSVMMTEGINPTAASPLGSSPVITGVNATATYDASTGTASYTGFPLGSWVEYTLSLIGGQSTAVSALLGTISGLDNISYLSGSGTLSPGTKGSVSIIGKVVNRLVSITNGVTGSSPTHCGTVLSTIARTASLFP